MTSKRRFCGGREKSTRFSTYGPDDAKRIVQSSVELRSRSLGGKWCKVGLEYEAQADARAKAGATPKNSPTSTIWHLIIAASAAIR